MWMDCKIFVSDIPFICKLLLLQEMAWCLTDIKPFPEPVVAQFVNAYMQLVVIMVEHLNYNIQIMYCNIVLQKQDLLYLSI